MSTNETTIESIIDEGVSSQIRDIALKAILNKAGSITLSDLGKLRDSEKYGEAMRELKLQEFLDAYVMEHKLVPDERATEPVVEVVSGGSASKGSRKKRSSKKKAAKSAPKNGAAARAPSSTPKKGKGGGGGSAAPGKKVNFRDGSEKQRYADHIEKEIRDRGGQPISTTELTDLCGGSSNQAREMLQKLVDGGRVVSTGQARATRYYWRDGAPAEVIKEFEDTVPQGASTGS